jgi:hypothetical protein
MKQYMSQEQSSSRLTLGDLINQELVRGKTVRGSRED